MLLGLSLAGCTDTQQVTLGQCGNRVVDSGEDCDGSAGCNSACRFSCSRASECPSGWGCDASAGICRVASGSFRAVTFVRDNYSDLAAYDFDQDGRDDLLSYVPFSGASTSVDFFGSGGTLEKTVSLPVANSVATGSLPESGAAVLVIDADASSAFQAARSRAFSPLVGALQDLSPGAKLLSADFDCDGLRDLWLLGGDADDSATLSQIGSDGSTVALGQLDISASEVVALEGRDADAQSVRRELTATGQFVAADGRRCEMLALPAPSGKPAVDIYAAPDADHLVQVVSRVTYPSSDGEPPLRWFFADLDNDGIADLVLGGEPDAWVSHGLGAGQFEPKASPLDAFGGVLGAGELDATPGTDLFTTESGGTYDQVRVLDLTGDSRADVAAVGGQRRVDIYRGHPSGLLSLLSVPLRGVPRIEDVGDFDGDGGQDLLLSESDSYGGPRQKASVVFSPVPSDGAAAAEVASFESIQQLAAGYAGGSAIFGTDAAQDIAALFTGQDGQLELGLLEGGADRLLRSRLPHGDQQSFGEGDGSPAFGHFFDGSDLQLAIVSDGAGGVVSMVGIPSSGDSPNAPPSEMPDPVPMDASLTVQLMDVNEAGISNARSVPVPGFELQPPSGYSQVGALALDLDGDGIDELYVASSSGVVQLRGQDDAFDATVLLASDALLDLSSGDANGDGRPDLIAVDQASGVHVFLAQKSGAPEHHAFPPSSFACHDRVGPDVAFLQADADPQPELVFNCYVEASEPGFAVNLDSGDFTPQLRIYDVDLEHDTLKHLSDQSGVVMTGWVVGDFNGDGVQDLAGSAPDLSVLFGDPR